MKKVSKKVDILIKPQHLDGAYQKRFSFSQRSILRILILLIIITTFLIIFLVSFIIKESFHSKSSWGPKLKNSNGNRDPRIPQYLETPYHPILLNSSFDQIKLPRGTISCTHDSSCRKWMDIYVKKLLCLYRSCGTVFIYHIRKAAGTTIRQVLQYYGAANKWSLLESEGKVLDHRFLDQPGITALISIRDPIDRIISLYWYEHVQYYCKVKTNETKASSLQAWVNHWRDSSKWKKNFTHYYPGSIYVEVENYYVKALTQWDGKHTLTRVDLEKAKSILQKFDLVMISEWLNITSRKYTLDAFVTGTSTMPLTHSFVLLSRNKTLIQRLQNVLAPDEVINHYFCIIMNAISIGILYTCSNTSFY